MIVCSDRFLCGVQGYTDSIRGLVKLGLLNSNADPVLHEKGETEYNY